MNIKKMLSYLLPINVHQRESKINTALEITWNNGRLVLDSKNTNYSYGSLQKVLQIGLKSIGFKYIKNSKHILVLGVAGGSVIKTLIDDIHYNGMMTGVEIDSDTIELANQYFGLSKIENLTIIIDDAQNFVLKTPLKFDLIIIDIFQDLVMPDFLFGNIFIENTINCLVADGIILFNTIVSSTTALIRNDNFIKLLASKNADVQRISKVEGDNELLIIKKIK